MKVPYEWLVPETLIDATNKRQMASFLAFIRANKVQKERILNKDGY
jgi:hypothetical protein